MPHPETQIPMARPHPTPQKHDSPNANPNGTAQQSADLTKRCACAAKCISFLARHVMVMQITMELRRKLTRVTSMKSHLQKLPPMAANLRRDDDDTTTTNDDKRRETTRDDDTTQAMQTTPRPPTINGNPSLRIREQHTSLVSIFTRNYKHNMLAGQTSDGISKIKHLTRSV